eukprot:605726-Prymnesium_polylepis.1
MLDVWKPEPGRFRDGAVSSWPVYEHLRHTLSTLSTVDLHTITSRVRRYMPKHMPLGGYQAARVTGRVD